MSLQTASILLVEDDLSLQESLRTLLEENGYETHAAATRSAAMALLRKTRPAVCLLDLNLPDGSGVDVLKSIVQEGLATRVIVMSAFPIADLAQRFGALILITTLTKPVCPDQLLELVDKITRT